MEKLSVGCHVIFTDEHFVDRDAIVTAIWTASHEFAKNGFVPHDDEYIKSTSLNLVYVSGDSSKDDPYGRQIERSTSVVHASFQGAGGACWRFINEKRPVMGSVIK